MKVLKILLIIFLLIFPASLVWAGELGLTWELLSELSLDTRDFANTLQIAATDANTIFMFGTLYDYSSSTTVAYNGCYNISGNTWTTKAAMTVKRDYFSAEVVNGKIYTIGGSSNGFNALDTVEEYDLAGDTWTLRSPMPIGKKNPALAVYNSKIYSFGGHDGTQDVDTVEVYDPVANSWTAKASFPTINTERLSIACVAYNNKIYVFRNTYTTDYSQYLIQLDIYDPANDTWAEKVATKTDSSIHALNIGLANNKIYLTGHTTYLYDPAANTFQQVSYEYSTPGYTNIIAINNVLYTGGGFGYAYLFKSVFNHPPVLSFTGEPGYEQDGMQPDKITLNTTYTYKIRYTDEDNDPPDGGVKLLLYLSPGNNSANYTILPSDPLDTNYVDGKDYYYSFTSSIHDGWPGNYRFNAGNSGFQVYKYVSVTGDVGDEIKPTLSAIYVDPHKGLTNKTQLTFRVKYTDPNDLAPSGNLTLVLRRSGSGAATNIQLIAEDSTDTSYSNGKFYTATTIISAAGDYTGELTVSNTLGYTVSSPGIDGTLNVTSDALGDLSAYDFDNWGPEFTAGLPFDNTLYVYNDGIASSSADVTYYLSPTASMTDAYQLKIVKSPENTTIPADSYAYLSYSIWIPAAVPPGSYYLGINLKSSNDIEAEKEFWHNELIQIKVGMLYNHQGSVYCYPSPAYLSKGDKIHFAALPPNAEISIMLPTGHIIKKFTADENGYVSPWDGSTDNDGVIGSGVYLVSVNVLHSSTRRIFKILVFR